MKKSSTIMDRNQCIEELKKKTEDLLHEIAKNKAEIALLDLKKKDLEPQNDIAIDMLKKLDVIKEILIQQLQERNSRQRTVLSRDRFNLPH